MYKTNILFQPFLFLIDFVGYLCLFWLKFKKPGNPKRVLLIRLEHIGDVFMATPAFRALRKRFPDAKIDVLVREITAPVLEKNKNIDKVIAWNAPWLSNMRSKPSWFGFFGIIKKLRKNKYDIAVDFHGDPYNILLASLVSKYRIGFGVRGMGFLLNRIIPYGTKHTIDRNLSLVRFLGADISDRSMEVSNFSAARSLTGRWICISPGSSRENKNWQIDRWAVLADKLIKKYNTKIVFTGGNDEKGSVANIIARMDNRDKTLNICGKTSLAQLSGVVKQCLITLSPDSGTMHLARALNKPLVGLFVIEDPREWGYDEPRYQNIKGSNITVDSVMQKVSQVYHKI